MKRTYIKLLLRGVRGSLTRFLSILGIVAIGTGFLAGLLATTPDMRDTADRYYGENRIMDVDIKGTLGLTDDDVSSLLATGVYEQAMPARVSDTMLSDQEGVSYVTRIYGVPLEQRGTKAFLNDFVITDGRMPENASECLLAIPNGYTSSHAVGEIYRLSDENPDFDTLSDTYAFDSLTVVGIVRTPYYMSMESEPSSVGSGKVAVILYAFPEVYSLDVYTDIFLTVAGLPECNTFDDSYKDAVAEVTDSLEDFSVQRCQIRFDEVKTDAQQEIDDARVEYDDAKTDADTELADARQKLDDANTELSDAKQEVEDGEKALRNAKSELRSAKKTLDAQIQQQRDNLEAMRPGIDAATYAALSLQIDGAEQAGQQKIDSGWHTVHTNETKLTDARERITDAETELADAEQAYQDAKTDADTQLSDAATKLDDAQKELDDLDVPEWYILDREDVVSFVSYKGNTDKVAAIAKVFPLFLFLVAALVALTTMTRMVEEERGQIGTLKALGYGSGAIMFYYIAYATLASTLGSILGMIIGFYSLPVVISQAYKMMYTLPATETVFRWNYALVIAPIAILCTAVATLWACLSTLKERPARLMLPRAPKAGKRILLERVPFLWNRLKFTQKVTARNIFRYKKRLFMTVIGIAGCTALLLTGFGLRDSISDIVEKQFGELYQYDFTVNLKNGDVWQENADVRAIFDDSDAIANHLLMHIESGNVLVGSEKQSVSIYVPEDNAALKQNITLRERKSGNDVAFADDSVVLTEKLCELLGLSVGDSFTLRDSDGKEASLTVTGITENYVSAFAFVANGVYEKAFGAAPAYSHMLARCAGEVTPETETALSERLLAEDDVTYVQFNATIQTSFENTIKNINYIVMVLILSAGALAMIVLYNLTNINICERKKELATIKVLGFYEKEVANYIYRETNILSILGTLAGFALGIWLHAFVVKTAEVDVVMFGRQIYPMSYLLAAGVTLVFTLIVDALMLPRVRSIDMVESMKAND